MVNQPWLFSVLWCSGVSSVTTNACQVLKEMKRPIWLLVSKTSVLVQIFLVQVVNLVLQLHAGWALLCAVLVWQRDLADLAVQRVGLCYQWCSTLGLSPCSPAAHTS